MYVLYLLSFNTLNLAPSTCDSVTVKSNDCERGVLTGRGAAVQVPQVVQLISQFNQFGLAAAMRRVFHLHALSLMFGQLFVIRHLLNDTSYNRSKLCLDLCRSCVRVLHCVMKQSSLRGRRYTGSVIQERPELTLVN